MKVHLIRAGFYDRQNRGFGRFITRGQIEEKNAKRRVLGGALWVRRHGARCGVILVWTRR